MADNKTFQFLLDRADISELVIRFATAIDSKDWKLFRSIYTDEIEVELSGGHFGKGTVKKISADEFTESVKGIIGGFSATQHLSSNHHIEVSGDNAICISYMQARHFTEGQSSAESFKLGSRHTNTFVRTADGWKIRKFALRAIWEENRPPDHMAP
jgi:ketosteroid isomerase-like protein